MSAEELEDAALRVQCGTQTFNPIQPNMVFVFFEETDFKEVNFFFFVIELYGLFVYFGN